MKLTPITQATAGFSARPLLPRLLLAAAAAATAFQVANLEGLGSPGLDTLVSDWVYNAVLLLAAATCLLQARLSRAERAAWLAFGVGLLCWASADIYWTAAMSDLADPPYPSLADVGYLAFYPAAYLGIALLVRQRVSHFTASVWLDGMIGAAAAAALGLAVLAPALVGLTNGEPAAVATNLAYPLGDLLLLSFVGAAVMLTGARLGWLALGGGIAVWGTADAIYLYQVAEGTYTGGLLDSMWLVGALLIASAALVQVNRKSDRREGSQSIVFPALFATIALGVLVWDHFDSISSPAIWLAALTILLVVVRLALSFRENKRLLGAVEAEALTDPLTGLPNRRKLMADLGRTLHGPGAPGTESVFVMFDLDGFKAYNDSFGHPAGDILLRRLGQALGADSNAYRLGGDEFCILARRDHRDGEAIVAAAKAALREEGDGFSISASAGIVKLPDEASDESQVLHLADQRMYVEKGQRSTSAAIQTRDILVRILQEREPELSKHLQGVARLAAATGRELELDAEALDVLTRAAELHDIGKIAIPDRMLHKPGPLDEEEWKLLRAHTLIGERILRSAPAMLPAARLVRSSHERWDGGGYPDGLVGNEIPLGARIICVCDTFDAITSERPYSQARTRVEALAEIRRCAGTQFDPEIVSLFCDMLESGDASATALEPALH